MGTSFSVQPVADPDYQFVRRRVHRHPEDDRPYYHHGYSATGETDSPRMTFGVRAMLPSSRRSTYDNDRVKVRGIRDIHDVRESRRYSLKSSGGLQSVSSSDDYDDAKYSSSPSSSRKSKYRHSTSSRRRRS